MCLAAEPANAAVGRSRARMPMAPRRPQWPRRTVEFGMGGHSARSCCAGSSSRGWSTSGFLTPISPPRFLHKWPFASGQAVSRKGGDAA